MMGGKALDNSLLPDCMLSIQSLSTSREHCCPFELADTLRLAPNGLRGLCGRILVSCDAIYSTKLEKCNGFVHSLAGAKSAFMPEAAISCVASASRPIVRTRCEKP